MKDHGQCRNASMDEKMVLNENRYFYSVVAIILVVIIVCAYKSIFKELTHLILLGRNRSTIYIESDPDSKADDAGTVWEQ